MSHRSAIVTGAASGIGRAISIRLARDGFDVLLADIRRDPITGGVPTEEVIRAAGGTAVHTTADVSSAADCARLVEAAVERTGSLDLLVNNAVLAGGHSKPLLETEPEDWDAMMAVTCAGRICSAGRPSARCSASRSTGTSAAASSTSRRSTEWSAVPATSPTASARAGSSR